MEIHTIPGKSNSGVDGLENAIMISPLNSKKLEQIGDINTNKIPLDQCTMNGKNKVLKNIIMLLFIQLDLRQFNKNI